MILKWYQDSNCPQGSRVSPCCFLSSGFCLQGQLVCRSANHHVIISALVSREGESGMGNVGLSPVTWSSMEPSLRHIPILSCSISLPHLAACLQMRLPPWLLGASPSPPCLTSGGSVLEPGHLSHGHQALTCCGEVCTRDGAQLRAAGPSSRRLWGVPDGLPRQERAGSGGWGHADTYGGLASSGAELRT